MTKIYKTSYNFNGFGYIACLAVTGLLFKVGFNRIIGIGQVIVHFPTFYKTYYPTSTLTFFERYKFAINNAVSRHYCQYPPTDKKQDKRIKSRLDFEKS